MSITFIPCLLLCLFYRLWHQLQGTVTPPFPLTLPSGVPCNSAKDVFAAAETSAKHVSVENSNHFNGNAVRKITVTWWLNSDPCSSCVCWAMGSWCLIRRMVQFCNQSPTLLDWIAHIGTTKCSKNGLVAHCLHYSVLCHIQIGGECSKTTTFATSHAKIPLHHWLRYRIWECRCKASGLNRCQCVCRMLYTARRDCAERADFQQVK